ncbi:MAG: serine/threonine protein phosphatase [Planctomycetaceae bacterium]|nr:serine/threonine protein phosphatase [Planctomycetaceae bacterium]
MSRTLAIGDIHGCFRALKALEEFVEFTPDDQIILLGDYVDRGLDTRGVLDWIINRRRSLNLITLRGNHEIMMLAARSGPRGLMFWKQVGGDAALMSYSSQSGDPTLNDIPVRHWKFLEQDLLPTFETDKHIFVHGSLQPNRNLDEQPEESLYWTDTDEWTPPHQSGKLIICGHDSQKNGLPAVHPAGICIDTWAHGNGWLTCLDTNTGTYWQTNERRERRTDTVDIST